MVLILKKTCTASAQTKLYTDSKRRHTTRAPPTKNRQAAHLYFVYSPSICSCCKQQGQTKIEHRVQQSTTVLNRGHRTSGPSFRPRTGQSWPETQELQPPKHRGRFFPSNSAASTKFQSKFLFPPNLQCFMLCLHFCLCFVTFYICAITAVGFKHALDFQHFE